MAQSNVRIVLDRDQRLFTPGERIAGRVEVTAEADAQIEGIHVALGWRTDGHGNTAKGGEQRVELAGAGALHAGVHSLPFAFQAPPGPLSYRGTNLKVGWWLRAAVGVAWAVDPKADEGIELRAGERPIRDYQAGVPGQAQMAEALGGRSLSALRSNPVVLGCGALFLAPFVLFGLGGIVTGILMLAGAIETPSRATGLFPIVWGLLFGGVPGLMALFLLRPWFAQRKLGPVTFGVEPLDARPGQALALHLSFSPRAAVSLEGAEAKLAGQERTTSGSGKNSSTRTHPLFEQALTLSGPRDVMPGESVVLSGRVTLPADAPPSFHAASNQLSWSVAVALRLKGWPDWNDVVVLSVVP